MNLENVRTGLVGAVGFGSSVGVQAIEAVETVPISEAVGVVSQIVILIATLIGLFKRKIDEAKKY
jgi:hypothetical protein